MGPSVLAGRAFPGCKKIASDLFLDFFQGEWDRLFFYLEELRC